MISFNMYNKHARDIIQLKGYKIMYIIDISSILKHLLVNLLAAANIVKIVKINNVLILYMCRYKITIYSYHIEKISR